MARGGRLVAAVSARPPYQRITASSRSRWCCRRCGRRSVHIRTGPAVKWVSGRVEEWGSVEVENFLGKFPSVAGASGFIGLTFCAGNWRFTGILWGVKKLEIFSSNPLAPGGPFWYITHPLRPKGARSILENRTVQKERDPSVPAMGNLRKGRGTQ